MIHLLISLIWLIPSSLLTAAVFKFAIDRYNSSAGMLWGFICYAVTLVVFGVLLSNI